MKSIYDKFQSATHVNHHMDPFPGTRQIITEMWISTWVLFERLSEGFLGTEDGIIRLGVSHDLPRNNY